MCTMMGLRTNIIHFQSLGAKLTKISSYWALKSATVLILRLLLAWPAARQCLRISRI
jgi:hypothetical protein